MPFYEAKKQMSFKINVPQVVHETIDGETVIINLDSGNYYSLREVGAVIWNLIAQGADEAHIVEMLTQRYNGQPETMSQGVNALLTQLQAEQLITPQPSDETNAQPVHTEPEQTEKQDFVMPVLESFTDMQDLLLLDPIHEVDAAEGWPKQPQP